MDTIYRFARSWPGRLALVLPVLFLWFAPAAMAQAQNEDPPGRVANLSWRDGGVVFAPAGEEEWTDVPVNRPLTRGDRLWTDRGARAELHLGSAALQLDGETHVGITELDDDAAQLILQQGTMNARVRELESGENFEIDTPNLAFRAQQPGDYRIDVSADGVTRVIVRSGQAMIYGEGGRSLRLNAGQRFAFSGRELAQVADPFGGRDAFDQWATERNRSDDQSVAARHIPRSVIGYSQLDAHGSWDTVAEYGTVWYPRVTVSDWAPYRHGRWSWIQPWGWTWVDDAPWGFAPFHYGRWAQIGPRWAWVPGRFERRPTYAPALVVFMGGLGGGSNWSFNVGSSRGVAWYPLAPGEAWRPSYRTSSTYLTRINRDWRYRDDHVYRRHASALTAVPIDDFRYGRPVRSHWRSVSPATIAQAPHNWTPVRPVREREMWRGERSRLQAQPPVEQPWGGRRGFAGSDDARNQQERAPREQERAQREQERAQREAQERAGRQQRQEQDARAMQERQRNEEAQRETQRQQQEQAMRGINERQQQQERQQEQARQQLERAQREAAQRQQNDSSARALQERAQREQQVRQQQEQQGRQLQEQVQRQQQQEQAQRVQRQQQEQQGRQLQEQVQRQQQQHEQAQRAQQQRQRQEQHMRQQQEQQARQLQERAQRQQQEQSLRAMQQQQQQQQAARAMQERQQQEQLMRQQQHQQQQQQEQAQRDAAQRLQRPAQPQARDDGRGRGQGQGQARGQQRNDDDEQRQRLRSLGRNG